MATVNFDMSDVRSFFEKMQKAARGDLHKELECPLPAKIDRKKVKKTE